MALLLLTGCTTNSGQNPESSFITDSTEHYPAGFENNQWKSAISDASLAKEISNLYFEANASKGIKNTYSFDKVAYHEADDNWVVIYTDQNIEQVGGKEFIIVISGKTGAVVTAYEGFVE